nr:MAG TPA: hypothetical protein [Caudoviricetes sp.]
MTLPTRRKICRSDVIFLNIISQVNTRMLAFFIFQYSIRGKQKRMFRESQR